MNGEQAREQALPDMAHRPAMDGSSPRAAASTTGPTSLRAVAHVVAASLLVLVAWAPSFYEIWRSRWFPVWKAYDLPLWQRLTNGESYYTHGPLVPLICLGIAYYIYKRIGVPARPSISASAVGWVLLLGSVLVHLVGVYFRAKGLSGFCLIGAIGALVLLWGGWPMARAYAVPIVFLVFMVPLPMSTIQSLNLHLKFQASEASVWITNHIFGVPAVLDGSFVHLQPDPSGAPKMLIVENVCGGLRSLIALTFFASLFAVVCRVKGLWRWVMLAMAVPVAIGCNIVRITGLNLVAHAYGTQAAAEGAWFHDLSGLLVFVLALAVLFGIEAIIIALSKLLKRDWTDVRLLPYLASIPRGGQMRFAIAPLVLLVVTASLSVAWAGQPMPQNISDTARHAVPQSIVIHGETFVSQDFELDEHTLMILETNDYLYRRYTSASMPRGFELLIVFSNNIRNGAHAPEVCLEGGGQHIVANEPTDVNVAGIGTLTMRELVTQRETEQTLHTYVFKCGNDYTTSYVRQQATIFFNGVFGGTTAGGLIRVTVPIEGRDKDAAAQVTRDAVQALMPHLEEALK